MSYDWHDDPDGKISDDEKHGTFECVKCGWREYDNFYFPSCGLCRQCKLDELEARRGEADNSE